MKHSSQTQTATVSAYINENGEFRLEEHLVPATDTVSRLDELLHAINCEEFAPKKRERNTRKANASSIRSHASKGRKRRTYRDLN